MVPPDSTHDVPAMQWLDWSNFHSLLELFPVDISAVARECHLICSDGRGNRAGRLNGAHFILWALLLWTILGKSLVTIAALLQSLTPIKVSPGALRNRSLQAEQFLCILLQSSIISLRDFDQTRWAGYRIFLADATVLTRPGSKGTDARIHHLLQLPSLCPQEIIVSDQKLGESFCNFSIVPTGLYLGDRAYSTARGIAHVSDGHADVLVRYNPCNLTLFRSSRFIQKSSKTARHQGNRRTPKAVRLRRLKGKVAAAISLPCPGEAINVKLLCLKLLSPGQWLDQPVWIHPKEHSPIKGRLVIVKIPPEKVAEQLRRIKREQGKSASTQQAFFAQYIMLLTTIECSVMGTERIVELYRLRWQIELEFKREKSIQGMDELPCLTPASIRVWLLAHMLAQQLIRRQLLTATPADRFQPASAEDLPSLSRAPWVTVAVGWQMLKSTLFSIASQHMPAFLLKLSQVLRQRTPRRTRPRALEAFVQHLVMDDCKYTYTSK